VGAVVDLGSTSVHLLVASLDGHRLTPLVDESVFLGLGKAVAEACWVTTPGPR
jgi:exopolyphosphatase/pppGpp-phosphohydrolase